MNHKTQRLFEAATKVPLAEYTGKFVTSGGGFELEIVHAEDAATDGRHLVAEDGTRFFWATTPEKCVVGDLDSELESWLQEHHETADEHVDRDKLEEARKLINEALSGVVSYFEDPSVAVVLP